MGDIASHPGDAQVRLLLIGNQSDHLYFRDLLAQCDDGQFNLDSAPSLEKALPLLKQASYDLLLCGYSTGNSETLHTAHELRRICPDSAVVVFGDHVDHAAVAATIQGDHSGLMRRPGVNKESAARAILHAIEQYCNERQRQKSEDMLRKLWRAVEQSADMVIITDRRGLIEYANPAFETVTGYSRGELTGKTPRILKSGQHSAEFYSQMWQTILSGQEFRSVMVNRKKNGETFVTEKTITPVRDAQGQVTHFISNDRDISERRRLEAQLQMTHKMDAIGRLAGGVAHDFNNLLMVISAYAELMQDALTAEHPLRRNVREILKASRRATDLTRQLLAFGRKQIQSLQLLDLNHVLKEIGKMLPRLIGEDIQLNIITGRNLGSIKADPIQIEQIVMNLAANARDAMPEGGKLTIETAGLRLDEPYVEKHSIVPVGDYVMLAVTDTGQGIAAEHLSHIFEPFYTTKEENKGTGLGLATVYGIVKQNGGFIWVYSEPGLGTTFKIYLPWVHKHASTSFPVEQHIADSPRGSETLLLVEDEAAVRQSIKEFLTLNGYTVLQAANGEEALRVARKRKGPIHLTVTDVVMPQLGGAKLAAQLSIERPEMKVLFVSGYAENTVLRHGTIDVTNSFLQKPFNLRALASKIRQVLDAPAPVAAEVTAPSQ